jgi:hypothetical protein
MMMKSVMAGAFVSLAAVAVPGAAYAALCVQANLTSYEAGGANAGCTIDDKAFTVNLYGPAGGVQLINSDSVTVIPLPGSSPGLSFNANWALPAGMTGDIALQLTVVDTLGPFITDATVTLFGGAIPPGSITDSVTFSAPVGPGANFVLNGTVSGSTHEADFAGVMTLTETQNITLVGGENLSIDQKFFSQTPIPEPASLAILGVSLLGMGAAAAGRRRFRK